MGEFLTGAGGAAGALDEILTRKRLETRQALLDSIAQENQRLAAQRENRNDELQRQAAKDMEFNREDVRASRSFENALPGEVDPLTAELWKKHGYGSALENKTIEGNVQYGGETPETRDPSRQAIWMEGGSKYQMAREAGKERAAQAVEAQKARDFSAIENDKRDQANRLEVQKNALAQAKLIADADDKRADNVIKDKKTEADNSRNQKLEATRANATQTLGIVDQLIDPKSGKLDSNLNSVVGTNMFDHVPEWYQDYVGVGVGGGIDKKQKLEQLKARLTTDLIMDLKALSSTGSTGMGNMSNKDVEILQNAAGMLSRVQSEAQLEAQLKEIRGRLQLFLAKAGGNNNSGDADFTYDINGNRTK